MTKLFTFIFIGLVALSCSQEDELSGPCSVSATVRDLTGLDGCGFVFELKDGTILNPQRLFYCGTEPFTAPKDDVLYNFEFTAGKKVRISYEPLENYASICMTGQFVKITCLTESSTTTDQ